MNFNDKSCQLRCIMYKLGLTKTRNLFIKKTLYHILKLLFLHNLA